MTTDNGNVDFEDIVLERTGKDWNAMLDQLKEKYKQSKSGSLLEAHLNSLVGAPPAILANYFIWGYLFTLNPSPELIAIWAIITWPIFFYLSVGRIWSIRRIFEKWGILLEPRYIYNWLKGRFKK